jgi:hypothetical protein
MNRPLRSAAVFVSLPLILGTGIVFGLLHGYFDHGRFEIKQAQWSASKQVAILAERTDGDALGGLTYFVISSDHLLTQRELRRKYYSDDVIFAATSTCIHLNWEDSTKLLIECQGTYLNPEYIDIEKKQIAGMTIAYKNISPDTAKQFSPK